MHMTNDTCLTDAHQSTEIVILQIQPAQSQHILKLDDCKNYATCITRLIKTKEQAKDRNDETRPPGSSGSCSSQSSDARIPP